VHFCCVVASLGLGLGLHLGVRLGAKQRLVHRPEVVGLPSSDLATSEQEVRFVKLVKLFIALLPHLLLDSRL